MAAAAPNNDRRKRWPGAGAKWAARGSAENPWIEAPCYIKYLMSEQNFCRERSKIPRNRAFSPRFRAFCPHRLFADFALFIFFILLIKKEEYTKKRAKIRTRPIHGFASLPIFSSTGFDPIHTCFRGKTWNRFMIIFNKLCRKLGVIHASTGCAAPGYLLGAIDD